MPKRLSNTEFGLIESFKAFQNLSSDVLVGIGDDAAVIDAGKEYLLYTTDMLVEGVHFAKDTPPKAIGYKALACSISDIAAMGGLPTFAVVSFGLPASTSAAFAKQLFMGMRSQSLKFNVSIVGGDTVKSDKVVVNVSLLGRVEKRKLTLRSGSRVGDQIFVSGELGGSLKSGRHLKFAPRVVEARFLVDKFKPNAMMDISDGLAGDLRHILTASKVGAVLEEDKIPCHKGVTVEQALTDGEDFELLFTLSSLKAKELVQYYPEVHFYHIGQIVPAGQGLTLQKMDGQRVDLTLKGFSHF